MVSVWHFSFALLSCMIVEKTCHFLDQSKVKQLVTCSHSFSRAWRKLHVFASNSDWLIVLFTAVVIGLWFWFYDTQLETALRQEYR